MQRAVIWAIRRYTGGPGRSWVWTSLALLGLRVVRSATGRRELIDISSVKPGQQIVIEHHTISHGKQIKQFKAEKKVADRAARAERKSAKRAAREAKRVADQEKRAAREAKRAAKAARAEQPRFFARSWRRAGRLDA